MEYRKLGKSGLKVSALGLGAGSPTFAGRCDEKTSFDIIHHAVDLGINYFDTAETYAEGRSETLLGKALKGKRSQVIIGTKFGKDRSVAAGELRGSRSRILKAVEGSLKRLDTDYIDLYVMHEPDPATPIEETLRTLNGLVRAGRVRYLGCSDFAAWQVCEAVWTSKAHNLEAFVAAGEPYNFINRHIEKELVACCLNFGIGVVPTSPLAGGFLTGKYKSGEKLPAETRFSAVPQFSGPKFQDVSRYGKLLTESNYMKLAKLESFARERGHTVSELAIAWLLSHPWLGMVPVGVTRQDQLAANVKAAEWKLSADDIVRLNDIL